MERVVGHVCRNALPPLYADAPEDRAAIGAALVDVLADLHLVDPVEVGLEGFGRPAGFVQRQLRRWSKQWEASRTEPLPALDELCGELGRTLPVQRAETIVHGDYRLDNTILHPTAPGRIVAVLDWEMSTLGDPLTDLGTLLAYWSEEADDDVLAAARVMAPRHGGRRLPEPLGGGPTATPRGRASTSPASSGTRRSRTSSSPSSARASPLAPPPARCWATASTTPSGSSRRWSQPAGSCSACAEVSA